MGQRLEVLGRVATQPRSGHLPVGREGQVSQSRLSVGAAATLENALGGGAKRGTRRFARSRLAQMRRQRGGGQVGKGRITIGRGSRVCKVTRLLPVGGPAVYASGAVSAKRGRERGRSLGRVPIEGGYSLRIV